MNMAEGRLDSTDIRMNKADTRMDSADYERQSMLDTARETLLATRNSMAVLTESVTRMPERKDITALGKYIDQTRKRDRQLIMSATTVIVVLILAVGGLLFQARSERQYLIECTTPAPVGKTHTCFEQAQRRTGEALRRIAEEQQRQHDAQTALTQKMADEVQKDIADK